MRNLFSKIFQFTLKKIEVNYLYFSIILIVIGSFAASHFFLSEEPLSGLSLFFTIYAIGQVCFEVGIFVLIAYVLRRWTHRWIYYCFIVTSFICLSIHFANFMAVRILDTSILYFFKCLFGFGISHVLVALQAINMNPMMIAIILIAIVLIPCIGILFYHLTEQAIRKIPMTVSLRQIALGLGSVGIALFVLDLSVYPHLTRLSYAKYQKFLPLGTTFLPPPQKCISLPGPIAPPPDEKELTQHLPSFSASSKPNLYLFVIETLRKDFITEEIAPHLSTFGNENIQFPTSYANTNASPLSWFSIFHSYFPYHWTTMRDTWTKGSFGLQILKHLGYKIRVYSSADLHYFNMDKMIFGNERNLLDSIEDLSCNRLIEPCDRDALAFQSFERDLQSHDGRSGNLFLFFLDATHSEYSFPKDFPLKFTPIVQQIDYLTLVQDLERIKNRYRNSVRYVDSLMGQFFETLKKENLYSDAVIAITADHGEEFGEAGAFFHGTHLNQPQTSVPIFFKFQDNSWPIQTTAATHLDIFPSLLHYLTNQSAVSDLFDGHSIFLKNQWPYRIAVLQNGPDTPSEFTLTSDHSKMTLRFLDPRNLYSQTQLEILSLEKDPPFPEDMSYEKIVESYFPNALEPLLKK